MAMGAGNGSGAADPMEAVKRKLLEGDTLGKSPAASRISGGERGRNLWPNWRPPSPSRAALEELAWMVVKRER